MNNKLEIKNLNVSINKRNILKDINFRVESKKSVCLIGKGSVGKTVLLKSILGLLPIKSGEVIVNNESLFNIDKTQRQNILDSFGVVFQKDALFDSLPVWKNIVFKDMNAGESKSNLIEKSEEILKKVGMDSSVLKLFPSELSGGMKKRVAIARAVSSKPKFLILDEPTAGLDPIKTNMIFDIIKNLSNEFKVSVLAVSSDIKGALKFFSNLVLLNNNKVEWFGTTNKAKRTSNPNLKEFIYKN